MLLKGYEGSDRILNQLQDSTNIFIKGLLDELTQAYGAMRSLKASAFEEIEKLQDELSHEKYKYEQLKS